MKTRNTLRRKRQKTKEPEERQKLCDEILEISKKIQVLKNEAKYCDDIAERSTKIKSNIKEMQENEKQKELEKEKGEKQR